MGSGLTNIDSRRRLHLEYVLFYKEVYIFIVVGSGDGEGDGSRVIRIRPSVTRGFYP